MINPKDWQWFGFAGHFICGSWCRFHLCTKVGKYVVSTVGFLVSPSDAKGSEVAESEFLAKNPNGRTIGYNRTYETMVFKFKKLCKVKDCNCGQPRIVPSELDFKGYNLAGEATKGHMELCLKWAKAQKAQTEKR